MKILILGGTVFVGRHLVEAALSCGHEVTLFNRGQRNADLFPEAEKLRGDRDGGLEALKGRQWDAVVDTCGYVPRIVRQSAELLAGAVSRYVFISTGSVYADFGTVGLDETSPLKEAPPASVEEITGDTYGGLKVGCEQVVEEVFPGRALILRPGFIVGPFDPTDRFTYWPSRIAQGGDVLAPGAPDRRIQIIDARDLAAWTVMLLEARQTGIYNAVGPEYDLTWGEFLETCRDTVGKDTQLIWVDDAFLEAQGGDEAAHFHLYFPDTPETRGVMTRQNARAIADGLTFRPLSETVRDTLAWDSTRPADTQRKTELTPEREAELLRLAEPTSP